MKSESTLRGLGKFRFYFSSIKLLRGGQLRDLYLLFYKGCSGCCMRTSFFKVFFGGPHCAITPVGLELLQAGDSSIMGCWGLPCPLGPTEQCDSEDCD